MAQRKLEVVITGDARKAKAAMGEVEGRAGRMRSKLASIGKAAAIGIASAGVGLAVGVAAGLKSAYDAAQESAKISRETARVIKTTGKAANVTEKHVGDYAETLAELTGVDDELIQSGSNLLLTFTNIRNEVGKGNDIFDQATAMAVDMSTALGTDVKSASIQLGKALNDPIKGITALSRAGVSFTKEQKDQIKVLVEAGDTLGAQKIILKELNKEFGGAAATAATPFDRLKVAVGNLQEEIGTALIPIVERIVKWLGDKLPVAIATAKVFWKALTDGITGKDTTDAEAVALKIRDAFFDVRDAAKEVWEKVKPVLDGIVDFVKENPDVTFAALATVITARLVPALWSMAAAGAAALGPIGWLAIGVAAIGAAFVYAYRENETFQTTIDTFVAWFQGTPLTVIQTVAAGISSAWQSISMAADIYWPQIKTTISTVLETTRGATDRALGAMRGMWETFGQRIVIAVQHAWGILSGLFRINLSTLTGGIRTALSIIRGDWGGAWQNVTSTTRRVWSEITSIISHAAGLLRNTVSGLAAVLSRAFDGVGGAVRRAGEAVKTAWNSTVGGRGIHIPGYDPPGPGPSFGGFDLTIPRLHSGGTFLPPTGSNEGLALLRRGERVVTPGSSGGDGVTIVLNNPIIGGPRELADMLKAAVRQGYLPKSFAA